MDMKFTEMKVTLLAYTPCPDRLVASAARSCYSTKGATELYEGMTVAQEDRTLSKTHGSPIEHAVFTFSLEHVSRAMVQQLTRHRLASYSQQSQRYVDISDTFSSLVLPPTVKELMQTEAELADTWLDSPTCREFKAMMDANERWQNHLKKCGIRSEDRRYFAHEGTCTNITVTMNARELLHFASLRCCSRAQWEIRNAANLMVAEARKVAPKIMERAGPSCVQTGVCPEHPGCGMWKIGTEDRIKTI